MDIFVIQKTKKEEMMMKQILSPNANLINLYDRGDMVQTRGYIDGAVAKGLITIPKDIRTIDGFTNIEIKQHTSTHVKAQETQNYLNNLPEETKRFFENRTGNSYNNFVQQFNNDVTVQTRTGPLESHYNLDTKEVWDRYIRAEIK